MRRSNVIGLPLHLMFPDWRMGDSGSLPACLEVLPNMEENTDTSFNFVKNKFVMNFQDTC